MGTLKLSKEHYENPKIRISSAFKCSNNDLIFYIEISPYFSIKDAPCDLSVYIGKIINSMYDLSDKGYPEKKRYKGNKARSLFDLNTYLITINLKNRTGPLYAKPSPRELGDLFLAAYAEIAL